MVSLGHPRSYLAQGKPDDILSSLGLDGPGVARSVSEALAGSEEALVAQPATVATPDPLD